MATRDCKFLIIGGGPAGLTSAINAASEGLSPVLIDSGPRVGGQARQSSLIENYAGFPEGISGPDLLDRFCRQAAKFATRVQCPAKARTLRIDGARKIITTDDEEFAAKTVLLSIGLSYMRLKAPGMLELLGKGLEYGAPLIDPTTYGKSRICIVGGANSAGQAAMHFSQNPDAHVHLIARSPLEDKMSQYLVDRIRGCANITVHEGAEVSEVHGTEKLTGVSLKFKDGAASSLDADNMFIFIGAAPKVDWLNGTVGMDAKHFILTGPKLVDTNHWPITRQPYPFETTVPGVFACGDVRLGSVKRVAAAAGEGSAVVPIIHEYLRHE
ncbi:MAG: thioredoxin reductase (NADPH) [Parcubacteria group bacterium Athens0416_74]|nr:MAG: thioredoxin reductase (NADPH) [Parcubacteria group bacterium Athens0416_74]